LQIRLFQFLIGAMTLSITSFNITPICITNNIQNNIRHTNIHHKDTASLSITFVIQSVTFKLLHWMLLNLFIISFKVFKVQFKCKCSKVIWIFRTKTEHLYRRLLWQLRIQVKQSRVKFGTVVFNKSHLNYKLLQYIFQLLFGLLQRPQGGRLRGSPATTTRRIRFQHRQGTNFNKTFFPRYREAGICKHNARWHNLSQSKFIDI